MSWWISWDGYERDASPNDFDRPDRPRESSYVPMTKEEEADYFDKLAEMDNDTIIW